MPASSKEFLDIQTTIECGFTMKRVRDIAKTYSQLHRTDKYSEHSSIIRSVWPNGWVFVYELSGSEFESSCSHLNHFVTKKENYNLLLRRKCLLKVRFKKVWVVKNQFSDDVKIYMVNFNVPIFNRLKITGLLYTNHKFI